MSSNHLRSGECKMEVTEQSSYLNRTGSVFYIGRHCENFFDGYDTLDDAVSASSKKYEKLVLQYQGAGSRDFARLPIKR